MKQVTRYLCEHCKKEFRTPDRHLCGKDPANRSCSSCGWFLMGDNDYYCEHKHFHEINGIDIMPLAYISRTEPNKDNPILSVSKRGKIHSCKLWERKEGE